MAARTATISRKTNETDIEVYINLDCQPGSGSQQCIDISTGIGFLDHVRSPPNLTLISFCTLRGINVIHGGCIDVSRPRKAQRHVPHAEGERGPPHRRSPHSR